MDFATFDVLAEPLQRRSAEDKARHGIVLIEGRTADPAVVALVESRMGVIFPDKYKAFMARYGGGVFGFVELLPIVEPQAPDRSAMSGRRTIDGSRSATSSRVAEVGTGDYWGFPVTDGRCHEEVWFYFHDHDHDDHEPVAADFLEFIAEYGLKSSTDRTLERRDQ